MEKVAINLLQKDLFPKRPFLTLTRMVIYWSIVFIAMVLWAVYSQHQNSTLSKRYGQLKNEQQAQTQLLESLQQQVKENRANPELIARLDTLKIVLANKKALHQQLTDQTQTHAAGYSSAMTELAQLHHKQISITGISIYKEQLTFSGMASKPEAVPAWLAGFESSTFLSGKNFVHFSLNENEEENGLIDFVVSSQDKPVIVRRN